MNSRIGFGVDFHQLIPGQNLKLGGISIPSNFQAVGHSDGDVLLHAICDALLGALNLGDIGEHFPSDDSVPRGIDSSKLLHSVNNLIKEKNYSIVNIDCTVVLQAPNISAFKKEISKNIQLILELNENSVSIKAKTTDHLGFIGKNEGIQAYAITLLKQAN